MYQVFIDKVWSNLLSQLSRILNGFPPCRHTEFKIWKDYEPVLAWHSNWEFPVWVSFRILCNLGNQPKLRTQECLSLSLSSIERQHCQAFYVNFCCAFLFDFFFKEGDAFFSFSSVSFRNMQVFFLNRWTSFFFPKNFEGSCDRELYSACAAFFLFTCAAF